MDGDSNLYRQRVGVSKKKKEEESVVLIFYVSYLYRKYQGIL